MSDIPTGYTVRITGPYGEHGEARNPEALSTTEAAQLCYFALLACGHAPHNVADAFEEIGREQREALAMKDPTA